MGWLSKLLKFVRMATLEDVAREVSDLSARVDQLEAAVEALVDLVVPEDPPGDPPGTPGA